MCKPGLANGGFVMIRSQHRNSEFSLRPETLQKLLDSARKGRDWVIIALFVFTGIRRAELRSLDVNDVDVQEPRILIRHGKGGKHRIVFYPPSIMEAVREYRSSLGSGPMFPGRCGSALSLRAINNIVAQTGQRAGVQNPNPKYKHVTPHLFRHSFARNWKRAGGSLESLQKILGHASMQTTMDLYGTESLRETEENYRMISDRLLPI
jgi:integrase/recombinase XerD